MTQMTRVAHPLPLPLSLAVVAGGFVFLSGQLGVDAQGRLVGDDVTSQTRFVLERIAESLQAQGASMAQVVKATVWLSDLGDFPAFNEEYRRHFLDGFPVRSTVEAKLVLGAKVEIEIQAWLG